MEETRKLCSKEDAIKNVGTMVRIAISLGATQKELEVSIKKDLEEAWGDKWIEVENQK